MLSPAVEEAKVLLVAAVDVLEKLRTTDTSPEDLTRAARRVRALADRLGRVTAAETPPQLPPRAIH